MSLVAKMIVYSSTGAGCQYSILGKDRILNADFQGRLSLFGRVRYLPNSSICEGSDTRSIFKCSFFGLNSVFQDQFLYKG